MVNFGIYKEFIMYLVNVRANSKLKYVFVRFGWLIPKMLLDAGSIPSRKALELHFFATGPGLGLIMYIFTTLKFPKHNFDFHLLTTSVNAKYYY